MVILYFSVLGFVLFAFLLSYIDRPHWIFRMFEFAKVHLLILQLTVFISGFFFEELSLPIWAGQFLLMGFIVFNVSILLKYTPLFKSASGINSRQHSKKITLQRLPIQYPL